MPLFSVSATRRIVNICSESQFSRCASSIKPIWKKVKAPCIRCAPIYGKKTPNPSKIEYQFFFVTPANRTGMAFRKIGGACTHAISIFFPCAGVLHRLTIDRDEVLWFPPLRAAVQILLFRNPCL